MLLHSGLGAPATPFGLHDSATSSYDCTNAVDWLFNAKCWPYSPSAWSQMAQFGTPPASLIKPPPAVDMGTSRIPAPYACSDGSMATAATNCPEYSAAVDAALASGKSLTDQALLDWYGSQPPVPDAPGACDSILGGGAMAVSFCSNPLPWILGALGAVTLLPVLLRGGR